MGASYRFREITEQLEGSNGLPPENQGRTLALTVLNVSNLLDNGRRNLRLGKNEPSDDFVPTKPPLAASVIPEP